MIKITVDTVEAINYLKIMLEELEYGIRATREWLLREYITMDWNGDGCPEHEEEIEDQINERLEDVNEYLEELGIGKLNLDVHGYITDIVKKAKNKKEVEKLRAEEYVRQVWNDHSPRERKKLMTAYLDGMLAADISNKKGGEE